MFYSSIPHHQAGDTFMHGTHRLALEAKHATLDARIAEEQGRPAPDQAAIAELKRQKLRLKEEISVN
ncbi:YdcH family protein [Sphingomonas sp. RS2018]